MTDDESVSERQKPTKPSGTKLIVAAVLMAGSLGLIFGFVSARRLDPAAGPTPRSSSSPVVGGHKEDSSGSTSAGRTGFGNEATGGRGGKAYFVTSLADSGRGTLRAGAESSSPRRIRFRVSGRIVLKSPIRVASNKTIDGKGARVTITRKGFQIIKSRNIIIQNLAFAHGIGSTTDAIQIREGAELVLVDHCDFTDWKDGLVDVTRGATMVTISWNRFHDQDKVMLINSPGKEGPGQVTLHHNLFERTRQRNPRVLFAQIHAYNNYLTGWTAYGMEVDEDGEILSQANVFESETDRDALRARRITGSVRSEGDLLLNGARVEQNDPAGVFDPSSFYLWSVEPADSDLTRMIRGGAGVGRG
jgi:pectate lyase